MLAASKDTELENKSAIRKSFEAWKSGTGSPFELLAADAKWTIVGNAVVSRTYGTRQEFLDTVITPFNARLARRLIPSVRALYADGDTVIALFDAEAIARDGKPYRNTYTWYMRIWEGKIVDVIAFFDTIEFSELWTRVRPK